MIAVITQAKRVGLLQMCYRIITRTITLTINITSMRVVLKNSGTLIRAL